MANYQWLMREMKNIDINVKTLQCNVSMDNADKNIYFTKISRKYGSISWIVRTYKSIFAKTINKMKNEIYFAWQPRFHDHIIRDVNELNRIRQFILDNPLNWETDDYSTK